MNNFLTAFLAGESFLFCFLLFFHPLKQNAKANKWLSFFAFIMGTAFIAGYIEIIGLSESYPFVIKLVNSLQFLLAPSIFISILYFVNPTSKFKVRYWLHFLPFLIFVVLEFVVFGFEKSISTKVLFDIGNTSFFIRDILPFQTLAYVFVCYRILVKHNSNLKLVTANTQKTNLNWLKLFLLILIFPILFWINDAFSIIPFLVELNAFIYSVSILFLAYYAMKQTAIFPFENEDLEEISEVINETPAQPIEVKAQSSENKSSKPKRLNDEEVSELSAQLDSLMEDDKVFLDNEINLASVAEKLGISIHDTSYLINEVTGNNFYNFINRHRVEEAKKLLTSPESKNLNMLGIAFESGFNSKTTFNTAFKKWVGFSPTEYVKQKQKS